MTLSEINSNEYAPFYEGYIHLNTEADLVSTLQKNLHSTVEFFGKISEEKLLYRYEEGKWTSKDILLHIIDAERIFTYRALRISRGDRTPLPGFDEKPYVAAALANSRSIQSLVEEYKIVRQATLALFQNLTPFQLQQIGTASGFPVSVRALGFIITGHEIHHLNVIAKRYL